MGGEEKPRGGWGGIRGVKAKKKGIIRRREQTKDREMDVEEE